MAQSQLQLDAKRIKQQTLNTTLQRPVAVYPTSFGVLAGVYVLAFGLSPLALGICAGGIALGVGGWLYEWWVRGDDHAFRIVNEYRKALAKQRAEAIARIDQLLVSLQHTEGQQQLAQLTEKFQNFEAILAKKLNVNELTYNRYLAISEQVFLNALDNLEQLAFALQSVSAIDMASINRKLQHREGDSEAQAPLLARANLWQEQHQKANALLAENEKAMTQLDLVAAKLSEVRTREGHATMDMELAMVELEQLIQKASQYHTR